MEDPFAMFTLALFVIAGFINTVHGTWGVTADASQAVYGNNATLQCNYQGGTGVILANLFIYNKDKSTTFLNYLIGANAVFGDPSKLDSRYSYNSTTNIMTISSVECVDDVEFVCEVTANVETFSDIQKKESRAAFDVQVRPSPPEAMTTVPASLKEGLKDGDSLAATCIANIGRPGSGRIKWVIYRDGVEEQVSDGDERVAPSEVSPASGEQSCTVRKKSTLTLNNLTHLDQKLVVTCFVMSDDFPSNPKVCNSTTDSLCQQSETIYIYYPVKELQVSREPQSDLVEGSSVTLKCTAKGFPEPTYQWTKVETNATLSASMNGKYSQLVLNNLDIDRDSGNYRCTAMNELKGETYNVSNDVHVLVVKTPPSTTASPTTDPGKASTQKTTKDPEDDDNVIIIVVVVVLVGLIIAIIVGVCIWLKMKRTKDAPPRPKENPYYNNRQTLGGLGSPPDVVVDEKKKPIGGILNSSFDSRYDDGLMHADLTYDNQPRSRKPMAIGDAASDYSDVQMPQV